MSESVTPRVRYRQNNKSSETNFKRSPRMLSFCVNSGHTGRGSEALALIRVTRQT